MDNLLSEVDHYFLVVYTDEMNFERMVSHYGKNPRIKFVLKPFDQLTMVTRHRDFWIKNHLKNDLLNRRIGWEVNALWSEKVHFVQETVDKGYFSSNEEPNVWYGWIDIGYFRCRHLIDVPRELIHYFPNIDRLSTLDPTKVHYGFVNPNVQVISLIQHSIESGRPIPPNQISVAGCCFFTGREKVSWWTNTYDSMVNKYIQNDQLIKDDQIIIAHCIFTKELTNHFKLHIENNEMREKYDTWFMFGRILL
jgi:hypothetical protein